MLFTQIIAFILVMVIFEAYPTGRPELSMAESLLASIVIAGWLYMGVRLASAFLLRKTTGPRPPADPAKSVRNLTFHLQVGAVIAFTLIISLADLKAHLMTIPPVRLSETLSGLCAVGLYLILLSLVWSGVHSLEKNIMGQRLRRWSYVAGQTRFVTPVIFPWLLVSVVHDSLALAWPRGQAWMDTTVGNLVFLALFLVFMSLFLPPLVRTWWGCRRLAEGPVREVAEAVLKRAGVRVEAILDWPILEGRMITAGILGLFARLRYLLITPGLAQGLTPIELAGVVAHEAGHVRHRHIMLYLLFFMGFFLLAFALAEPLSVLWSALVLWLAGSDWGFDLLTGPGEMSSFLSVLLALPLFALLVIYLRYIMGFFMRHFERQADFFALELLGDAKPIASALERVAWLSGNIRDLPSWHHFSIAQRVEALNRAQADHGVIKKQARLIKRGLIWYLSAVVVISALGFGSGAWDLNQGLNRSLSLRVMEQELKEDPYNHHLLMAMGLIRFEAGEEKRALAELESAFQLAPRDPEVLNSLAWVLATAQDPTLRNPHMALLLAQEAVRLSPAPHIWDTLAEAYFLNLMPQKALAAARSALAAHPRERLDYYHKQLARFEEAAQAANP